MQMLKTLKPQLQRQPYVFFLSIFWLQFSMGFNNIKYNRTNISTHKDHSKRLNDIYQQNLLFWHTGLWETPASRQYRFCGNT